MDIKQSVFEVISDAFQIPLSDVTVELSLRDDDDGISMDDLDQFELTMRLEDKFNIVIPDDIPDEWELVGDIVKFVELKLS